LGGGSLNALATLERFFFEPRRFRGLYVMRAAFGAIALYQYLRLLPYVQTLFGPAGINGYDTAQRWPKFPLPATEDMERFALLRHISSPLLIGLLYAALLLAAAAFTLGARTRLAGVVLLGLHLLFASHQPELDGGWVRLYAAFLAYLVLLPSGAAWSFDAWLKARRHGPQPPAPFVPWALRLLQVHVIAMYATASWPRLLAEAWLGGETVLYAVADTRFGRWELDFYALRGVLAVVTWVTLVVEPAATVLLPLRATRRWCALALLGLHLGIEMLADTGMWQFMMSAALLAFLPDRWFAHVPGLRQLAEAGPVR
jgi:hypothetical protein